MADWRSAAAWAAEAKALKIDRDVLPHTRQGLNKMAERLTWPRRQDQKTRAWEYPLSALPQAFQNAVTRRAVALSPAALPPAPCRPAAAALKDWQRQSEEARLILLAEVDRLQLDLGVSARKAILALVLMAAAGELPAPLAAAVPLANMRRGENGERTLSYRTLYRWLGDRKAGRLAPIAAEEVPIPAWADTFLALYSRPTKPDITEVLADLWPAEQDKPSYGQVRRFLAKLDTISRHAGRMGPRALKAMRTYRARDVSELWPGCVFIGDGHTHKKEVAHPIHGQPFRPEITSFLDVYTRKWVGWSSALAENTWAVADALLHAVSTTTACDILYYDNGSGAKNKAWDDDVTGLAARLGMTKMHSAPWSSQSRGIIERFHRTVLHRVARRGETYVGSRMDEEARRKAYKITRKDIKASGTSRLLPSWAEFIAEIDAEMVRYNDTPHGGLPKIRDPLTGAKRHQTPNESWAAAIAEGWTPDPLTVDEARQMFRPRVERTTRRALVEWIGNEYYAPELEALHGKRVVIAYDLHDATRISVYLRDGRYVTEAIWNGHQSSYVPVSFAEKAREQRVEGKLKRLERHADVARAELTPQLVIDHQPIEVLTPDVIAVAEAEFARLERHQDVLAAEPVPYAASEDGERPKFLDDESWARWVLENPDKALPADRTELRHRLRNRSFCMFLEMQGLDVGALSALAA